MARNGSDDGNSGLWRRWYVVVMLCALFIWSYVDRLILGLLAVDIGKDLHIGDTQLGLLVGTSFAIVYSIAGVPIANQLDKGDRKTLVISGCILWSATTMLSGLANGFYQLAILRMGVAVGEAVLTPAAISMIADLFPPERRATPTTLYTAMGALMGVGGLALSATVISTAQLIAPSAGVATWRLALILCGIPSLLLILIFWFTVNEPAREEASTSTTGTDCDVAGNVTFGAFAAYLRANAGFYLPLLFGCGVGMIFNFAFLTWTPAVFIRVFGLDAATAGYKVGLAGMTGLLGAFLWSRIAVWAQRKEIRHNTPLILAISCLVTVPVGIATFLLPRADQMLVGFALLCALSTGIVIIMPLVIQAYGPPRMRARLIAMVYLSYSLVGYGLGPVSATLLAQFWQPDTRSLAYGISLLGGICLPTAALLFWLAYRTLKRKIA